MLALLLFVTVAVTVSSVVHLAARRQVLAARSADEAASLLELAQTVLGGADTPTAVLDHLTSACGGRAELAERVREHWVRVAVSGTAPPGAMATRVPVSGTVALVVAGQSRPLTARLLDGFAAQAGAALDRDRLRTQAAQAEALAEGNRMRTALLGGGQPRPAHPAGLDQGQRQHAAADRCGVDRRPTRRRCSPRSRTARTGWTR